MAEKPGKMAQNVHFWALEPLWFVVTYEAERDSGRNCPQFTITYPRADFLPGLKKGPK